PTSAEGPHVTHKGRCAFRRSRSVMIRDLLLSALPRGPMADIFVSYRRDDSQWPAGRINERLEAVFGPGRVFFATVTIPPGEDFPQVLGNRVGSCRVLLAVIGPRWLDILEARLGEPHDFVRIEIAEGLQRKVRVVPVLIDGAKPPPGARLPD